MNATRKSIALALTLALLAIGGALGVAYWVVDVQGSSRFWGGLIVTVTVLVTLLSFGLWVDSVMHRPEPRTFLPDSYLPDAVPFELDKDSEGRLVSWTITASSGSNNPTAGELQSIIDGCGLNGCVAYLVTANFWATGQWVVVVLADVANRDQRLDGYRKNVQGLANALLVPGKVTAVRISEGRDCWSATAFSAAAFAQSKR
jgi:hypothetical protein